ncbi:MAG: flagellar type III secretion system pore protein FliP [Planctomycetes bacterium]|nr:flagellar type III secretion system pore protein FliP [Planctomycetota bacterium]
MGAEDLLRTLTGQEPSQLSTPLRLLALLTVLSLVPSIVLMTTCFPRIVIVFSFLRRAMGTQDLPPSQIMIGLALFLTAAVMTPTWQRIYQEALAPYMEGKLTEEQAFDKAVLPLKSFMLEKTLRKDLRLFVELSRYEEQMAKAGSAAAEESVTALPLQVIIPAFLISELKVSFQMGFVLYLPFLIIDLVVSTTLISMGMLVLPPFMISFPLKVLVFVLVDGWNLIVEQLVKSFL